MRASIRGVTVRVAVLVAVLVAAGCAGVSPEVGGGGLDEGPAPGPDREDVAPEEGDGFDRQEVQARAEALLGLPEDEVETSATVRIARRGEEHLPGTMDLRPGRLNVELDETSDGRYVVTRVMAEVPDGEPLVVE